MRCPCSFKKEVEKKIIYYSSNKFIRWFHQFFPVWAVKKENEFLIGPKYIGFCSHSASWKRNHNKYSLKILMIYPLDRRNTKKPKCRVFTNNSLIFVKLFKKKPKYWHIFFMKNPKITILFWVLVFSVTYLVLVYSMDST